jgi:heme exporter protein A
VHNALATAEQPLPARPSPAVMRATALAGQRGDHTLFERLELALAPGSVTWLRGRNGCGKTSLLRLLAGLATPLAGEIEVGGASLRRAGSTWRKGLVYVAHHSALKDDLTAGEALRFLVELQGARPDAAALDAALQRMGVGASRSAPVRTLSQGQRRRVALARLALTLQAPLWLLDEPFDALDAAGVAALNALLTEHAAQGGATLLTSHQPLSLATPVPQIFDLDRHGVA